MRITEGWVAEIRLEYLGHTSAKIAFSGQNEAQAIPEPGQYLMAWKLADIDAPLAVPIFPAEICTAGFWTASTVPGNWEPGDVLQLRGPLGHGFKFPAREKVRRLALGALGETIARLLPLAVRAIQDNLAVTLFTSSLLPSLPADLEIYPLGNLPEALSWADFLALDLTTGQLPTLRKMLGLNRGMHLPCPAQALILNEMPCGGLAECGACAVPGRRKWRLACQDGPVFDLDELDW
jgi:NAD(P)H-flavin reductase